MVAIPFPTIQRMSYLYDALSKLEQVSIYKISSTELGKYIGQTACIIRKDIHLLGYNGVTGVKYDVIELKKLIVERLGFGKKRNTCVIGLGKFGNALLEYLIAIDKQEYRIVAGFDSNINRLETIQTSIDVYPAYKIEEIVRKKEIKLALITVPFPQAQEVADKCCEGGIEGILNFSPLSLTVRRKGVFIRSCDVGCELNVLSALTFLKTELIG